MPEEIAPARESFSLFELNQHLRRVVQLNMREPLWIRAEIADLNHSKGSVYLSLVERDAFQLKAKSDAVIWPRDWQRMRAELGEGLERALRPGQQVLIQAQAESNEYYGLKLVIRQVDAGYAVGQLEQQRAEALAKLGEERLLELNKQLELPRVPQRIAVISSKDAAGLQDFWKQLNQNPHRYAFRCTLFEAAMQGANVERDIRKQIQAIEHQLDRFDCVVLVRGGGARLDLVEFDGFELCKALATCELPILTGIGHDVDESLADLVAHTALKTPTAVAEFLVNRCVAFENELHALALRRESAFRQRLQHAQLTLTNLEQRAQLALQKQSSAHAQRLAALEQRFELAQPEHLLRRGFAILVDENGGRISSAEQLRAAKSVRAILRDGEVSLRVELP